MVKKEDSRIINGQLLVIEYGLKKIGNQVPYFSITGTLYCGTRQSEKSIDCCGCIHETILNAVPGYSDIVALHLSDIDGVPMHAAENGFYWLCGAASLAMEYGPKEDQETCLKYFMHHMRISENRALGIIDDISKVIALTPGIEPAFKAGKERFSEIVESEKPRWKQEATAVIQKYHLKPEVI